MELGNKLRIAFGTLGVAAALSTVGASVAQAQTSKTYTYNAPATASYDGEGGKNQFDLDHYRAYTWSIQGNNLTADTTITGATLTFHNIRNWDNKANRLFVNLFDYANNLGHNAVASVRDTNVDADGTNGTFSDYFDGPNALTSIGGVDLLTLVNVSTKPSTISHTFSGEQLGRLNEFFRFDDTTLAFGLDPDCHFWNDGLSFSITTTTKTHPPVTTAIPEPGTYALLAAGLLPLAGLVRRRRNSK